MAVDPARPFKPVKIAVLTVSDTRDMNSDTSGALLVERVQSAGHQLTTRAIEKDDVGAICSRINTWIDEQLADAIVITGGTGLTGRDVTPEALDRLMAEHGGKQIPGFGELFRWISYASIGTSTIQSRACAVLVRGVYIFALPGSNGAVKDGWDKILAEQFDSRYGPCNFVELMPRLREV
ncbi:MAG TPA: molybdenum cofactor synthesis domain-containing protein [Novosphingobium sp.]|nr:molybdenum cofactor synthesis domain-containing protein [Novosphingobium sp.]